ncbi:MAG: hypothetical protein HQL30_09130, partial [Candidatus Omnitrophica bacterium]|nr:hypothetical protein [Candidatus Omnitrophota bacterium]
VLNMAKAVDVVTALNTMFSDDNKPKLLNAARSYGVSTFQIAIAAYNEGTKGAFGFNEKFDGVKGGKFIDNMNAMFADAGMKTKMETSANAFGVTVFQVAVAAHGEGTRAEAFGFNTEFKMDKARAFVDQINTMIAVGGPGSLKAQLEDAGKNFGVSAFQLATTVYGEGLKQGAFGFNTPFNNTVATNFIEGLNKMMNVTVPGNIRERISTAAETFGVSVFQVAVAAYGEGVKGAFGFKTSELTDKGMARANDFVTGLTAMMTGGNNIANELIGAAESYGVSAFQMATAAYAEGTKGAFGFTMTQVDMTRAKNFVVGMGAMMMPGAAKGIGEAITKASEAYGVGAFQVAIAAFGEGTKSAFGFKADSITPTGMVKAGNFVNSLTNMMAPGGISAELSKAARDYGVSAFQVAVAAYGEGTKGAFGFKQTTVNMAAAKGFVDSLNNMLADGPTGLKDSVTKVANGFGVSAFQVAVAAFGEGTKGAFGFKHITADMGRAGGFLSSMNAMLDAGGIKAELQNTANAYGVGAFQVAVAAFGEGTKGAFGFNMTSLNADGMVRARNFVVSLSNMMKDEPAGIAKGLTNAANSYGVSAFQVAVAAYGEGTKGAFGFNMTEVNMKAAGNFVAALNSMFSKPEMNKAMTAVANGYGVSAFQVAVAAYGEGTKGAFGFNTTSLDASGMKRAMNFVDSLGNMLKVESKNVIYNSLAKASNNYGVSAFQVAVAAYGEATKGALGFNHTVVDMKAAGNFTRSLNKMYNDAGMNKAMTDAANNYGVGAFQVALAAYGEGTKGAFGFKDTKVNMEAAIKFVVGLNKMMEPYKADGTGGIEGQLGKAAALYGVSAFQVAVAAYGEGTKGAFGFKTNGMDTTAMARALDFVTGITDMMDAG